MPRVKKRVASAPPSGPNLLCPFTNTPIRVIPVRNGIYFQGVGEFYSTKLYHRKEDLLYDLSKRGGAEGMPPPSRISTREVQPAEANPIQDQIDRAVAANELAEKMLREA